MASTRFHLDPDRIFPDHAYAPGYEPAPRVPIPEDERERVLGSGDLVRFACAAVMAMAGVAALSGLILSV